MLATVGEHKKRGFYRFTKRWNQYAMHERVNFLSARKPLLLGILIKQIYTQKKIGKVDEEKGSHLHSSNQNHAYWRITKTKNVQNNHSQYKN